MDTRNVLETLVLQLKSLEDFVLINSAYPSHSTRAAGLRAGLEMGRKLVESFIPEMQKGLDKPDSEA